MPELHKKSCVPCQNGEAPLKGQALETLHQELDPSWSIVEGHHLEKSFPFKDFKEALHFTNKVGDVAEQEGHHPDILLSYGKVSITLWTHKINGLSESDFILAAKIDTL